MSAASEVDGINDARATRPREDFEMGCAERERFGLIYVGIGLGGWGVFFSVWFSWE